MGIKELVTLVQTHELQNNDVKHYQGIHQNETLVIS